MGLLRSLLFLPVKGPLDAAVWVAAKLAEHAESDHNSPVTLRAALAEAEQQLLAGELSESEYDAIEDALLLRLKKATRG